MKAKLTASYLKQLEPNDKPFEVVDSDIKGFLIRVQPTGRQTCYYSYRSVSGKRQRIKIGVIGSEITITQARDKAQSFAGKVADGINVQAEKNDIREHARQLQQNTLRLFIEQYYQAWALANLKSGASSIESIHRAFKPFLNFPLVNIDLKLIEHWRIQELNRKIKPSTINRLVASLRGVLTKAVEWDVIPEHPLRKLKPLKVDEGKKARFLSPLEGDKLFTQLNIRDKELIAARTRANEHRKTRGYPLFPNLEPFNFGDRLTPLVTLALKTGMRRGEIFDLEWDAVDFTNKVVTVVGETAKSSRTRHIPLSPNALETLIEWRKQADPSNTRVFPADNGGRLDNVNTAWRNTLKAAGIESFRWHDMRHDFASKLVMKGVPLNTVRELCGHADLNTTLRYAHLAPDHKAGAIAMLG